MAEIQTPPVPVTIRDEDYEAFGEQHSLADIVRWLMRNLIEAAEVRDMLNRALSDA